MNFSSNQRKILLITLSLSLLFSQCPSFAKLSYKQKKKLEELSGISKPVSPIFGKITSPLIAGVAVNEYLPKTVFFEEKKEVIALAPLNETENKLSALEEKRKELQKEEEEGLNFIQPSLGLTEQEQKSIDDFFSRNEQEQLLNLWKATIERNKTIQFIIQKLAPVNSPQQGNSVLSKALGAAIFLPFYAIQALGDNAGAYYGSQVGGRVLGSIVEGRMRKDKTQLQLSQTETIILFMMIDEVAERLRQRYHAYKKLTIERALASNELEETKKDIVDAQEISSPETQVLANIQRRAIEREVRNLDSQIRSQKNALVELAGFQSVDQLDEQLKIELAATSNTPLDVAPSNQ